MGIEIERKFLVVGTAWRQAVGVRFSQGYLNRDKERTVRVRLAGEGAFLTIKGRTENASRAEFEYGIPVTDAKQLLKLCEGPVIEKIRRVIVHDGATWGSRRVPWRELRPRRRRDRAAVGRPGLRTARLDRRRGNP